MKPWLRTLLYYLAAFFGGVAAWLGAAFAYARMGATLPVEAEDPYYGIISLAPLALNAIWQFPAAVVLRKLARRLAWRAWWQWALAGTLVTLALLWGLGAAGNAIENARLPFQYQTWKATGLLLLLGPMSLTLRPWWVGLVGAGLTATLLWAVGAEKRE